MAVNAPRRKLISFRISDDEFEQLNLLRAERGTRSVSELARVALQEVMSSKRGPSTPSTGERLDTLHDLVLKLEDRLGRLEEKRS